MALPTPIPTIPFTDWDWADLDWDDVLTNWDQTDPPPDEPPPPPPPPATGGIWAADLNGLTFGIDPYRWEEDGPDIFGTDNLRTSYSNRPGADGAVSLNPDWLGIRTITLPVFVNLFDEIDALRAQEAVATAWMRARVDQELVISTPLRRYTAFGRPGKLFTGISDIHYGLVRVVAQFVATDPLFYSDLKTIVGTLTSTVGGVSFPFDFPHDFGQSNSGGVTLINEGNTDSDRVVIILTAGAGGLVNPRLELPTVGRELVFNLALAPSQQLWIDFAARTARLNNTTSRSGSLVRPDSNWWSVPAGSHLVRFAGTGDASIEVRYRSAWVL